MPANSTIARSRRILVIVGYAVLVVAFAVLGFLPFASRRAAITASIAAHDREIAARLDNQRAIEDLKKQVLLAQSLTRNFEHFVYPDREPGPFLQQLSRELDSAGIRDLTVRTLPPNNLTKTQKLPIEIHGRGTYAQCYDLLTRVESLPRKASVGRLTLDADSEMSGQLEFQLILYIYNTKPGSNTSEN